MTNEIKDWDIVQAMHIYGGSFARAIAEAFDKADLDNQRRLKAAFPEMWSQYWTLADARKRQQAEQEG